MKRIYVKNTFVAGDMAQQLRTLVYFPVSVTGGLQVPEIPVAPFSGLLAAFKHVACTHTGTYRHKNKKNL